MRPFHPPKYFTTSLVLSRIKWIINFLNSPVAAQSTKATTLSSLSKRRCWPGSLLAIKPVQTCWWRVVHFAQTCYMNYERFHFTEMNYLFIINKRDIIFRDSSQLSVLAPKRIRLRSTKILFDENGIWSIA